MTPVLRLRHRRLGFTTALGVLLDMFFVRTLMVPAIAALNGRWNWWQLRCRVGRARQ